MDDVRKRPTNPVFAIFHFFPSLSRTVLLLERDLKERERLALKFIKVMKVLRKHNNFNSYLAFLSALDSASVRRLEWSRTFNETIDQYSAIIDFTGSFKAYREALSTST